MSWCCCDQEQGETSLHVPALLRAWGRLSSTLLFIYLPAKFLWQKYSRNASDRPGALVGPQACGGRAGRALVPRSPRAAGTMVPEGLWGEGPLCHGAGSVLGPVSNQDEIWGGMGTVLFPLCQRHFIYLHFFHLKFSVWLFYPYNGDGAAGVPHCGRPRWPWGEGSAAGMSLLKFLEEER